jgi:hypothetical protein
VTNDPRIPAPAKDAPSLSTFLFRIKNVLRQGAMELASPEQALVARSTEAIVVTGQGTFLSSDASGHLVPLGPPVLAGLASRADGRPVDLVFRDNSCIDISFSVPAAPLAELGRIIETEVQFRSPFAEAMSLPFWNAREQADGRWKVKAAVVLRTRVAELLADLQANRVPLGQVWREGPEASFAARPVWAGGSPDLPRLRDLLTGLPAALKYTLAGSVIFLASAAALTVSLSLASGRLAAEAEQARARLSAEAQNSTSLQSLERALARSADRLAMTGRLSGLLPDGYWLDQLSIDQDTVTLTGYGPSAAEVTRLLTSLPNLSDIAFASPVTRDNSQSIERYRISAMLAGSSP